MKKGQSASFIDAVEARHPGLVAAVRAMIEASERQFGGEPGTEASYLWEHTTHVASLAFELARSEKTDPMTPTMVALFHDAGKFSGGAYHQGGKAEEETAAVLADRVLRQLGLGSAEIRPVTTGLRSLYNSRAKPNRAADIVHDADFLSKFGALGIAQFFIKSTLRGRTLEQAIANQLSKELTYAACLPLNMRTHAGKRLAEKIEINPQVLRLARQGAPGNSRRGFCHQADSDQTIRPAKDICRCPAGRTAFLPKMRRTLEGRL